VTYLREALLAGATLINDAYITRILTNAAGDRATGVEYFDSTGARQQVDGKVIALGAYAIENPRILLNSSSSAHPDGLANSSGLVGAYMMAHVSGQVFGLFDEDTDPYMGRTGGELWSQAQYATDEKTQWLYRRQSMAGRHRSETKRSARHLHDATRSVWQTLGRLPAKGESSPRVQYRARQRSAG
jgi:hypothetical protein